MGLLLKRPRQQDYLALEILMESDLRRLKTKGYNVDRILRQKAAEARIADSERQKREEEQRREAEEEAKLNAQTLQSQPALTNGTPNQQQLPSPDTPERTLSMPGAFDASPPSTGQGKKPSVFNTLSKRLGINQNNNAAQQMQNMLTNGNDLPPPYEPRDPNPGSSLGSGMYISGLSNTNGIPATTSLYFNCSTELETRANPSISGTEQVTSPGRSPQKPRVRSKSFQGVRLLGTFLTSGDEEH